MRRGSNGTAVSILPRRFAQVRALLAMGYGCSMIVHSISRPT